MCSAVTGRSDSPPLSSHPLEKPEGVRAELWDHPMPQKRAESSPLFKAESVMLGIRHEHRRRRRSAGSKALARELDEVADATVRAMDEVVSAPAALAVYRRDQDVPPLNV